MSDESYHQRSRNLVRHRPGRAGVPLSIARKPLSSHGGIGRKKPPTALNDTERLVLAVLDEEWVRAREVAGFAEITVTECRRALATLRTLGMAESQYRRKVTTWRRA